MRKRRLYPPSAAERRPGAQQCHERRLVQRRKQQCRASMLAVFLFLLLLQGCAAFIARSLSEARRRRKSSYLPTSTRIVVGPLRFVEVSSLRPSTTTSRLYFWNDDDNEEQSPKSEEEIEEEARLKILASRRNQIRSALKTAEGIRNFRVARGWVPEVDPETGKPIRGEDGGKLAVTITAFCVAAGAIALRIGGRAALVSAVGLDFVTDNPEVTQQLQQVLDTADGMDWGTKLAGFVAAWTLVKVSCFDAGGIALALGSGILFGGVIQGAVVSAAAATFGSSVAFGLSQLDTPFRQKALQVLDEYPSLRGVEKVVARDGFKAILTLRLAPILPIPIGLYNYIYGVTQVPFADFCCGIFLGSLKPYLLDSYLGYFGKNVIEGTQESGLQDVLLLAALGLSILVGVFASQLAGETWESVLEEVEAAKLAKQQEEGEEENDGITRQVFGMELPQWIVGFQLSLQYANERMSDLIQVEYEAQVWNYTKEEDSIPDSMINPAKLPDSPEVRDANQGIDLAGSLCDGLVLSPLLWTAVSKYSDPLYDLQEEQSSSRVVNAKPKVNEQLEQVQLRITSLRQEAQAKLDRLNQEMIAAEATNDSTSSSDWTI